MPGRPPPPRRSAPVALALALVVLAGGCGWWEEGGPGTTTLPGEDPVPREVVRSSQLGPFVLETGDMAGPGTPLGGGLSVPDGAALLGIPFPDLDGGGFRALLLVTGDLVAAFDAMASQARALGMEGAGGCEARVELVTCRGHLVDPTDGEALTVEARRAVTALAIVSGLALRYQPPGSGDPGAGWGQGAIDEAPGPTAQLLSVELPPLIGPPPLEDVVIALRSLASPPRTVEVGTTLVGLPGPCACDGPGWSFVVSVQGRVRDVIAAYARQFSDLGVVPNVSDRYQDGLTTFHLEVGEGTRRAEVRALAPDGGPVYLLVAATGV